MNISIALCTYNGEAFLQDQLDSFTSQSLKPYELVVCDDGSNDETLNILQRFRLSAPFPVRIFQNETNLGVSKNFERTITLCTGDIIALSDQDDVWLPHKLSTLNEKLEQNPQAGFVFSDAILTDEKLNSLNNTLWKSIRFNSHEQRKLQHGQSFQVLLKHRVVTGAAMGFRTDFREMLLPIPENWIHDAWISIVLAVISSGVIVEEPLMYYRQHQNNQIGTAIDIGKAAKQALARGKKSHLSNAEQHERLLERLRQRSLSLPVQERQLKEKIAHMRARAELPRNHVARTLPVLRELIKRRYEMYSSGWYSATRDWLYGN
jgi:glycosyltransferase involved in cell wall biosynthesis